MNTQRLSEILGQFPSKTIAVVGDFFLDRYWLIDESLNEPSVETGLDAYQVVGRRHAPGAAGTVVNNLRDLGIEKLIAIGFSGTDGEGFVLRQALTQLGVNQELLFAVPERVTPTYTKPMIADTFSRHWRYLPTPTGTGLSPAIIKPSRVDLIITAASLSSIARMDIGALPPRGRTTLRRPAPALRQGGKESCAPPA